MFHSQPTDEATHETAVRMAVACRRVVQACLREEEWVEADRQFYLVIREGLERYKEEQIHVCLARRKRR